MSKNIEGKEEYAVSEAEVRGRGNLTWRAFFLAFVFGLFFSVATIYTLVVLSFSMGVVGIVSVIIASSAATWGINLSVNRKVMPLSPQEAVGISWLSTAMTQSFGTTVVVSGVLLMRYILPSSAFPDWQRWWFAPPGRELGSFSAWMPTILFWMLVVFLSRLAVIGVGAKLRRRYIETDELPFPVAEAQADMIKELTTLGEPPIPKLRYFLVGMIIAITFSLVVEHNWDYPLLTPLLTTAAGIVALVGATNNAFPWKVGKKLPRGLDKVAYYFAYPLLFIGFLGLISYVYAPSGSILFYLRNGFGLDPNVMGFYSTHPDYALRFIDFSFLIPQLSGLGFGISLSILLFIIGYLIPADQSSGILIGSLGAFVLIPLAILGFTGSVALATVYSVDSSLVLVALLCATIVGSAVTILRTVLSNRHGAKQVIIIGVKEIYGLARVKKPKVSRKASQKLSRTVWNPFVLIWIPLIALAFVTIAVVGIEPTAPWYLSIVILVFALIVTPVAITLGAWVTGRTTRITSVSPLPFLYEGTLFGTGVKTLSPYAFGAPTVWQAPGILSQLRVARLTRTESRVVYWADLIGFPIMGVLLGSLVCIWVFSSIGTPHETLSSPGTGSTLFTQWNFSPVWSALYTFVTWLAQGGGAFPYQCDPMFFFVLPLILLAAWTILHGFRRIPIGSIAGIAVGFAVLPYMAITIALGTFLAVITKKLKGVEWFSRYGTTLGAGLYAGASVSLFLLVFVAPLIP
nr:OPT/YSL family transporter [Candidatus Njordarchaeota archaeon]